MTINQKEEKDKLIKKEINKLKRVFKKYIPENKHELMSNLINELAFMSVTLNELKDTINEEGAIDVMPQGEYSIKREHPCLKTYNTMIQRYGTIYKQLADLYTKEVAKKEVLDELESFLG